MTESKIDDITWAPVHTPGFPASNTLRELWVRGDATQLSQLTHDSVAIVGSRSATMYGEHLAGELGQKAAKLGLTVINGGAFGIDAAALRGAMAQDGKCVVVQGRGLDAAYPVAHTHLFDRVVAAGGLIVSAYPPGTLGAKFRFLERNRLIAELARGTVVVEAALRGGSIDMAQATNAKGKPLLAIPGPITSAMSAGCHQLIHNGSAELAWSVDQALACFTPNEGERE
jgi:DNA processing protein